MSDILVLVAISTIVIGALLLAGLAIWLAIDRNRQIQDGRGVAGQPGGNAPARPQELPRPTPAASQAPTGSKTPGQQQEAAGPAEVRAVKDAANTRPANSPAEVKPAKDAASSGEYPAAGQYDQTLLPPPKRRTRSQR